MIFDLQRFKIKQYTPKTVLITVAITSTQAKAVEEGFEAVYSSISI